MPYLGPLDVGCETWSIYFYDPNGIRLEFSHQKEAEPKVVERWTQTKAEALEELRTLSQDASLARNLVAHLPEQPLDFAAMKILGICGSLRKASYNIAVAARLRRADAAGHDARIARIDDLPMFNQDVFDAGIPEPAKRLRAEIAEADGVLIASPEYNFSLSAALKNAIDWASRPPNQSWQDKPVAMFSATGRPLAAPAFSTTCAASSASSGRTCCRGPKCSSAGADQVRRPGQDHR